MSPSKTAPTAASYTPLNHKSNESHILTLPNHLFVLKGQLIAQLFIDFLLTYNLPHTLSVFQSEASLPQSSYARQQLVTKCHLKSIQVQSNKPVLSAVLQSVKINSATSSPRSPRHLYRDIVPLQSSQSNQQKNDLDSSSSSLKNLPALNKPSTTAQPIAQRSPTTQPAKPLEEIDEDYSTGIEEELSFEEEEVESVPANIQKSHSAPSNDVNTDYPSDIYSQDQSVSDNFEQEFDYIEPIE